MKAIGVLALALLQVLAAAQSPGGALDAVALQSASETPASVVPTTPPVATPAATVAVPTTADDGNDDELIGVLRPDEAIEQPEAVSFSLLADAPASWWPFRFKTGDAPSDESSRAALRHSLLAATTTNAYTSTTTTTNSVPCTNANNLPNKNFRVLVAVSSCFDKTAWTYIEAWVDRLDKQNTRYFEGDKATEIDFVVRTVDDGCDKPKCAKETLTDRDKTSYVAIISIMVYTKGDRTLQTYKSANSIPTLIGYVYCGPLASGTASSAKATATALSGYTPATWIDDANGFMGRFNPFGDMRKILCTDLPNGVPTSYLEKGQRKCFCSCPVGFELKDRACRPLAALPVGPVTGGSDDNCACAWSTKPDGYKIEVTKYEPSGVCEFKNQAIKGTTGVLPVPVVVDNYVDHLRKNGGDGATGPRIELLNKRVGVQITNGDEAGTENVTVSTAPRVFEWTAFQTAAGAKIDELTFSRVGRYDLSLKATDYGTEDATCPGCVIVVDAYRPSVNPSSPCPTAVNASAELTVSAINAAQKAATGVKDFKDKALNDPCSPNKRCDVDALEKKRFVDTAYNTPAPNLNDVSAFFDVATVRSDLTARLQRSPFDSTQTNGVAAVVQQTCERCVRLSTILREWWTDYKCGASSAAAKCEGSTRCELTQCVRATGATLATAAATVKPSVQNASLAVVRAKAGNENKTDTALSTDFKLGQSVHVALACTRFPAANEPANAACTYTANVSDLIDLSVAPAVSAVVLQSNDALFTAAQVKDFVSWRYRVDGGAWRSWDVAPVEVFTKTETTLTVEAWTSCGQVQSFPFRVVMHLNTKIEVCEKFTDMWYQATRETPSPLTNVDLLCMHPRSDFAEVTFDYHPNIGLASNSSFEMTIAGVSCQLRYDDSSSNATIVNATLPSAAGSYQVVKQFAIDGANAVSTRPETRVFVACTFTYKRKLDSATDTQICNRKFVIKDCTPPRITQPCPLDGKCDYNKCAARKGDTRPDLFQACGGNRISQSANLATTINTTEAQCCDSCDTKFYSTSCRLLRDAPASADNLFIKRCEAVSTTPTTAPPAGGANGAYGSYGAYSVLAAATETVRASTTTATTTGAVLLSAMVALVALVVVRRRGQQADRTVEEDAYYPLLG